MVNHNTQEKGTLLKNKSINNLSAFFFCMLENLSHGEFNILCKQKISAMGPLLRY